MRTSSSVVNRSLIATLLLIISFSGCAHEKIYKIPVGGRTTLIPYGVHRQSVTVHVKKEGNANAPKKMNFSGVMDYRADHTQLIGLSPFGSTLFRLNDDAKTKTLTFTTDNEQMKKAEPYLKATYAPIREMLAVPYPPLMREVVKGDLKFRFEEFNDQEMPMKISITTPDFDLTIDEDGYEP
jgi:hypothetical protein